MSNPDAIVSKSEFAKLCGVVPGRVTQWINEGKISGAALVGEGRSARIRVEVALRQLKLRRDVGQALANGSATRLDIPVAFVPARAAIAAAGDDVGEDDDGEPDPYGGWAPDGASDDIDRKLKRAKLEAAERDNRIAAAKEAAAEGVFTETAAARSEMGKIAGQMMRIFEGALPEIATAIAAEFKIDARDVTHHLNEQFRKVREQAAAAAAKVAAAIPETIDASG
ncbi:hypothetical protein [Methylobacterium gregans]|uniref:Uncharacterized protein n=1 Tax=Methylobacterium gregans TaxID=374424 RepID=A0AA37MA55_9HYPH|nr:hypothetical protein [Methylobacterium gregans]MDQ0521964.1 hypothetical protein [Methylobacterium gregans]GJD78002.1 hypothetical protein NBEOAGPD_1214 [Methylobacterium gregans]GLS51971.1 hypothetical protein GCM10007886_01530 [Methylobacterium gregans]